MLLLSNQHTLKHSPFILSVCFYLPWIRTFCSIEKLSQIEHCVYVNEMNDFVETQKTNSITEWWTLTLTHTRRKKKGRELAMPLTHLENRSDKLWYLNRILDDVYAEHFFQIVTLCAGYLIYFETSTLERCFLLWIWGFTDRLLATGLCTSHFPTFTLFDFCLFMVILYQHLQHCKWSASHFIFFSISSSDFCENALLKKSVCWQRTLLVAAYY